MRNHHTITGNVGALCNVAWQDRVHGGATVFSGNNQHGVYVNARNLYVYNMYVGVAAKGFSAVPNNNGGVLLDTTAVGATIGHYRAVRPPFPRYISRCITSFPFI